MQAATEVAVLLYLVCWTLEQKLWGTYDQASLATLL